MSASTALNVTVLNRQYNIKAPAGAAALLTELAAKLNAELTALSAQAPQFSRDELLMLTALNALQREQQLQQQHYDSEMSLQQLLAMMKQQLE